VRGLIAIGLLVLLAGSALAHPRHHRPRAPHDRCEAIGIMYVRCIWKAALP